MQLDPRHFPYSALLFFETTVHTSSIYSLTRTLTELEHSEENYSGCFDTIEWAPVLNIGIRLQTVDVPSYY
jgi:hypothetical protein